VRERTGGRHRARATRALTVVVAAIAALSMAATPGAAARDGKPVVLTADQIQPALLTADELPDTGLTALPVNASTTPAASRTGGVCDAANVYALAEQAASTASGAAYFHGSNTDGPFDSEVVFSFPTAGAAARFVELARDQVEGCKEWSATVVAGDPPTHWTLQRRSIGRIGDERLAYRQTGSGGGDDLTREPDLPSIGDAAIVRVGHHVVATSRYGLSNVITSGAELRTQARRAAAKLERAVHAAKQAG